MSGRVIRRIKGIFLTASSPFNHILEPYGDAFAIIAAIGYVRYPAYARQRIALFKHEPDPGLHFLVQVKTDPPSKTTYASSANIFLRFVNNVQTAEKARFFFSRNVPATRETLSKVASATAVGLREMFGTLRADFLKYQSDVSKSTFFNSSTAAEATKMLKYPYKLWQAMTISYVFSDRNTGTLPGDGGFGASSRGNEFMLKLQNWENPRPQSPKKPLRKNKKKSTEPSSSPALKKRMIKKKGAESSSSAAQEVRLIASAKRCDWSTAAVNHLLSFPELTDADDE